MRGASLSLRQSILRTVVRTSWRALILPAAVALIALVAVRGTSAQEPGFVRLPTSVLDVLPPSARVRGAPGEMKVQPQVCRSVPTMEVRRRIVDVAVQEWGFFGFGLAAANEIGDNDDGGNRGPSIDGLSPNARRGRRSPLPPGEAARVAASIAGYWAVTPEGSWIVARQNDRWEGSDGIAARWNAPWSAAFVSWVMCEAGLAATTQFERAVAHHTYIDQAIRARDGRAPQAAFVAYDVGEAAIEPGDLLCSARRPAYRTIAERRRQTGVGARSHCDVVVSIDESRERVLAIGGNVRGVVSLKQLPAVRQTDKPLRLDTGDSERPMFAHLKLRAAPIGANALDTSPTMAAARCTVKSKLPSLVAAPMTAVGATASLC
jgi:hypothetical protein